MGAMSEYDFSGLTDSQQTLLSFQGWRAGQGMRQPDRRTVKKLIDRGLLIEHERRHEGVAVLEYEVPIPVHMAWCEYCTMMEGKKQRSPRVKAP